MVAEHIVMKISHFTAKDGWKRLHRWSNKSREFRGTSEQFGSCVRVEVAVPGKLQALVYDILPSTTAVFSYVIRVQKTVS